jgi:translation elongation factor EF-G
MPYETITTPAEGRFRFKTHDAGFAEVHLRISPVPERVLQLKSEVPSAELPERFIDACFEGIRECTESGPIEGHPIRRVKITLLHAVHHPDHSTEEAFRRAGSSGFEDLFLQAGPAVVAD